MERDIEDAKAALAKAMDAIQQKIASAPLLIGMFNELYGNAGDSSVIPTSDTRPDEKTAFKEAVEELSAAFHSVDIKHRLWYPKFEWWKAAALPWIKFSKFDEYWREIEDGAKSAGGAVVADADRAGAARELKLTDDFLDCVRDLSDQVQADRKSVEEQQRKQESAKKRRAAARKNAAERKRQRELQGRGNADPRAEDE
jgi:hypothetical protein